ncbi:MAG: thiamine phosphate synthase [Fibromonadaceae bacterium]|jgi:thiamine-phosphate pyrophosphorylase|nr:thiamine phosphate synthase [Fibromonadaceae bacterium]
MVISKLHCLTWDGSPLSHIEQVRRLLNAGADWIQLRQKKGTEQEKLQVAKEAVKLAQNKIIIINDSPQICLESGANGVHLGLKDCSVAETRKLLGKDAIIGGTANTPEQAKQREAEGCNYIGLGPWRATQTKENLSEILGENGVKKVADLHLSIPIIVIGGVLPEDVSKILSLGAHGIAASSYLVG